MVLSAIRGLLPLPVGCYRCPWVVTDVRGLLPLSVGCYPRLCSKRSYGACGVAGSDPQRKIVRFRVNS